ncbi:hypothetical protein ACSBR1_028154 [Camellia fascicularis]
MKSIDSVIQRFRRFRSSIATTICTGDFDFTKSSSSFSSNDLNLVLSHIRSQGYAQVLILNHVFFYAAKFCSIGIFVKLQWSGGPKAKPQFAVKFNKSDIPMKGDRAFGAYVVQVPRSSGDAEDDLGFLEVVLPKFNGCSVKVSIENEYKISMSSLTIFELDLAFCFFLIFSAKVSGGVGLVLLWSSSVAGSGVRIYSILRI